MSQKLQYLIRKGALYYRPKSQGYTALKLEAGRYTLDQAVSITHPNGEHGPRDDMSFIHESFVADETTSLKQSRWLSLLESLANILVGVGVALSSQLVLFPLFGIHVSMSTNLALTFWFTAISLARSYVIRRWFNGLRFRSAS